MPPDIYIIAPTDIEATALAERLRAIAGQPRLAALLLPRGNRGEEPYHRLVRGVAPAAQDANIAVIIEGDPDWVQRLGVDGLHVGGGIGAVRDAVAALKPGYIVGAGDIRSRHDAMQKAEAGVDYILFGPLSGRIDDHQRELAAWWAETMEIPCVLSDPQASAIDAGKCEFVGLGFDALEQLA